MALDAGLGANSASGTYDIDNSLKLEGENSEKLVRTPSSDGNKQVWTISCWVKRIELSTDQMIWSAGDTYMHLVSGDNIQCNFRPTSTNYLWKSNAVFRDTAAWYHIVTRVNTQDSTVADRVRVYVNGEQLTTSLTSYQSNSGDTSWNSSAKAHHIGNYISGNYYMHGYVAEFHSIDGQSLGPGSFAETNADGEWVPKQYSGSYGSQGFYLDFADADNLGDDESGNGNDFTASNITSIDQARDTPTNNFCTLNNNSRTNGNIRTTHGGTYVATDGGSGWVSMNATMGVAGGKWYWEGQRENNSDGTYVMPGVAAWNDDWIPHRSGGYYAGNVATGGSIGWYYLNGNVYNGGSGWDGPSQGDITMFALDMDNEKLYFGVNGTWENSSNPATNTNGQALSVMGQIGNLDYVLPTVSVYQGNRTRMNFGGYFRLNQALASGNSDANGYGVFEYEPPSGFYALCTKNLAEYGG